MRAQLTSPKRHPGGGGIVEGGCEQDRRDGDAPREAGPTGTLFQRRLATARRPRGGDHRWTAHRIPGRAPTPPGADAQTDGATGTTGTTGTATGLDITSLTSDYVVINVSGNVVKSGSKVDGDGYKVVLDGNNRVKQIITSY